MLTQTSGFVLMATVAILYLTTEKNHPVFEREKKRERETERAREIVRKRGKKE